MQTGTIDALKNLPDLSQFGEIGKVVMVLAEKMQKLEESIKEEKQITKRQSDYLTLKEAAIYLNRSYMSIYRLVNRGLIRATKDLRDYRIHINELEAYRQRVTF